MPADQKLLAEVPFFQLLDGEERMALAKVLDEATFKQGETIFNFGDPGDALYLVRSGKVELYAKDHTGQKIILAVAEHGDFFGELSLLDNGPRTATATALEDTDTLVLDRGDLQSFIHSKPDAALDMLTVMGQRMRQTGTLLRDRVSRNSNDSSRTFARRSASDS